MLRMIHSDDFFLRFRPFFSHYLAIFGKVPAGEPQISVEEGRVEVQMVR